VLAPVLTDHVGQAAATRPADHLLPHIRVQCNPPPTAHTDLNLHLVDLIPVVGQAVRVPESMRSTPIIRSPCLPTSDRGCGGTARSSHLPAARLVTTSVNRPAATLAHGAGYRDLAVSHSV